MPNALYNYVSNDYNSKISFGNESITHNHILSRTRLSACKNSMA